MAVATSTLLGRPVWYELMTTDMSRKYFDRNRPAQARVGRLIDFAHPTGSDTRDDFVRAEPGWNRRHCVANCSAPLGREHGVLPALSPVTSGECKTRPII